MHLLCKLNIFIVGVGLLAVWYIYHSLTDCFDHLLTNLPSGRLKTPFYLSCGSADHLMYISGEPTNPRKTLCRPAHMCDEDLLCEYSPKSVCDKDFEFVAAISAEHDKILSKSCCQTNPILNRAAVCRRYKISHPKLITKTIAIENVTFLNRKLEALFDQSDVRKSLTLVKDILIGANGDAELIGCQYLCSPVTVVISIKRKLIIAQI